MKQLFAQVERASLPGLRSSRLQNKCFRPMSIRYLARPPTRFIRFSENFLSRRCTLPSLAIGETVVHGAIATFPLNFYTSRTAETGDALSRKIIRGTEAARTIDGKLKECQGSANDFFAIFPASSKTAHGRKRLVITKDKCFSVVLLSDEVDSQICTFSKKIKKLTSN